MNDFLQSLRNGQAEKTRTPKTRKSFDNSYHYSSGSRFHSYPSGGGYQNTRSPQMKRPGAPGMPPSQPMPNQVPSDDQNTVLMADILDNLSSQIDILVKNQEYMITIQERTADLLQRQADAIEIIMENLSGSENTGIDSPPPFEHHYVSSQEEEDGNFDETVEDLLKAEMAEKERRKAMPQPPAVKKRRKIITSAAPPAAPAAPTSSKGASELLPREEIMNIINTMREQGATYDQVAKQLIDLGQPTFSGRGEWHAQTIHRLCSNK